MSIADIITLGIGPDSDIEHLVLTGLGIGEVPPTPPEPIPGGAIVVGIPAVIFFATSGADLPETGEAYALPAYATRLTWQTSYGDEPSAAEINLQISLDGTHWATVDTSTEVDGESRTLQVNGVFVRVQAETATDGGDIKVSIIAQREKL